jgi:homoserine kinase type II
MGVKTKISKKDLAGIFDVKTLFETKNGVSDSVYIVNNKYVLKIFEKGSQNNIKEELRLYKKMKHLKVAKIIKNGLRIKGKDALVYKKCDGKSLQKVKIKQIKQIGKFLKEFHKITKGKTSKNKNLFSKVIVKDMVKQSKNKRFQKIYRSLKIELKNDGIIHGDIFKDNVLFQKGKLSCIIDFCEACNGDFYFDLAVIGLDWCRNDKEYKILLKSYGADITLKKFKSYIKYAGLYYALMRYFDKRDYKELLKRIERFY